VDKNVLSVVETDEPITFRVVEPLDRASSHEMLSLQRRGLDAVKQTLFLGLTEDAETCPFGTDVDSIPPRGLDVKPSRAKQAFRGP